MVTHSLPRLRLIMFFDAGHDGELGTDGTLTPTGGLDRLLPTVAQNLQQSRNELFDGVVLRGSANGKVQFRVRFNSGLAALHLFSLLVEELPHSLDICRSCSFCRQSGDLRLDEFAQFEDIR